MSSRDAVEPGAERAEVDRGALRAYLRRIGDRWPLERAHLGGARVSGREERPPFFLVLVSSGFDGVPWLERVRQAESLWDAAQMGDRAEVHCYTPVELERQLAALPAVRGAVDNGLDLMA
jgi:hypothetical protein